jgi:integrase
MSGYASKTVTFLMTIDEAIAIANTRLKSAKIRIAIERRGNCLWLRGTLPPKPHIDRVDRYRQKVSLGANATLAGLQYAEQKAKLMGAQLDLGKFDWADWMEVSPQAKEITVCEWVTRFEEDYWARFKRTPDKEVNWKKDYWAVFSKLPGDEALTLGVLLDFVKTTQPDSRSRKRACDYCHKLAEFAELSGREAIKKYKGNYSASSVDPRFLPTDSAIALWYLTISNPAWQWVAGMLAAYGLRNHEVFRLDLKDFPVVRVLYGKTGSRIVLPLYPEWADAWELKNVQLPNLSSNWEDYSNAKLGNKVSGWFYDNKAPFKAYDLRHCYARRCFEFALAPDWAAGLMGHSTQVHEATYRAWIDEATYLKVYRQLIYREGRPLPP